MLKELYISKNLNQLNERSVYKPDRSKYVNEYLLFANKAFSFACIAYLDNDEEFAYVLCIIYLDCMDKTRKILTNKKLKGYLKVIAK